MMENGLQNLQNHRERVAQGCAKPGKPREAKNIL